MTEAASRGVFALRGMTFPGGLLAIGFAALTVPALYALADQSWSQEFGAYGPIVLGTGLWLLWRKLPEMQREGRPGAVWLTVVIMVVSLISYVFGRAYDFLTLETAGIYGVGLALLQSRFGEAVLVKHWFPLLYLAFVIPPPGSVLADVTSPLKQFVSMVSTDSLNALGVPVARQGVTIFVAQYQLLVEDACSGMNSIVGLIAVSLLYIYLTRGSSWVYSLILTIFVIPIAVLANAVRIMTLILMTYFLGNEMAQGFLHFTAGMLLFSVALICVFCLDKLINYLNPRLASAR